MPDANLNSTILSNKLIQSNFLRESFPATQHPTRIETNLSTTKYDQQFKNATRFQSELEKILGNVETWREQAEALAADIDSNGLCVDDLNEEGLPIEDQKLKSDFRKINTGNEGPRTAYALEKFLEYFDRLVQHISKRSNQYDGDQNPDITDALINHAKLIFDNFINPFVNASKSFLGQFRTIEHLNTIRKNASEDLSRKIGLNTIKEADDALVTYDTVAGMSWDIKELVRLGIDKEIAKTAYWDVLEARFGIGNKTQENLESEWLNLKRDYTTLLNDIKARSRFLILEANLCNQVNGSSPKLADLMPTDIGRTLEKDYSNEILRDYKIEDIAVSRTFFHYDGLQTLHRINTEDDQIKQDKKSLVKSLREFCYAKMKAGNVANLGTEDKAKLIAAQTILAINTGNYHDLRNQLMEYLLSKSDLVNVKFNILVFKAQIKKDSSNIKEQLLEAQRMKTQDETFSNPALLAKFLALELVALSQGSYYSYTNVRPDFDQSKLPSEISQILAA